jgi:hypothetical protein
MCIKLNNVPKRSIPFWNKSFIYYLALKICLGKRNDLDLLYKGFFS